MESEASQLATAELVAAFEATQVANKKLTAELAALSESIIALCMSVRRRTIFVFGRRCILA